MNNRIINTIIFMFVLVVFGLSGSAFAKQGTMIDVSPEGKAIVSVENSEMDSKMVDTKDMQDTTSNYGISPTWGNDKDKESWYDVNILGH